MGPGEQSPQALPPRRPPIPRHRMSVDGIFGAPIRRPITAERSQSFTARSTTAPPSEQRQGPRDTASNTFSSQPLAPVLSPLSSQPIVAQSQPSAPIDSIVLASPPSQPRPTSLAATNFASAGSSTPPLSTIGKPLQASVLDDQKLEPQAVPDEQQKKPKIKRHRMRNIGRRIATKAVIIPLISAVVLGVLGGGTYAYLRWRAIQNNPTTIFNSALSQAFTTTQLEAQTSSTASTKIVHYDLTAITQPVVSVQLSQTAGDQATQINGYGTSTNTYISYAKLPISTPAAITTAALNSWVQIRANNLAATGISNALASLPDPRYQAFGALLFANTSATQRQQLINFIKNHNIYAYKVAAVQHTTYSGTPALAYDVTINAGYLKVLNQSLASLENFTPGDIQIAVNQLTDLTGATMYVSARTHQFVGMTYTLNGHSNAVEFSYAIANFVNEPQTKLAWASFAPIQFAIEAQSATLLTPAEQDSIRTQAVNTMHTALAAYQATNGFYPTLANLNDQNWVATNLAGLDPETFRDPLGTSLTLASAPKAGSFAYQATPDSHNGACVNAGTTPCTHYAFITTLSSGKQSAVSDP